jgi:isoquinoline 1-oxidoreductase beta subunit
MMHRRTVLRAGLAIGGGLLLSLHLPGIGRAAEADTTFAPNAFIRIDHSGAVTLIMADTECGQGIWTSSAMLLAEELEVGLDQVQLEAAPPNAALYANPLLGLQATGGSTSIRADWRRFREAGAIARTMLIAAAAAQWGVEATTCKAARATVIHPPSGRSVGYGALVDAAAKLPVPHDVPLKDPSQFTLIGHSQHRLDTPSKVNGSAVYGIDVRVPGMKIGTVAASPVPGGRLTSIDEAAARQVPGVRDVIRLDDTVAVIGDHMWAAKQGLAAASPVWDDGPNAGRDMGAVISALDTASQTAGVVALSKGDAAQAIAAAAKHLDSVYQLPFLAHAPMEPINTTIHVRPDGAEVWVGTQVPTRTQDAVAQVTGLPAQSVVVHNLYMGGAFGRRLDIDSITQAAQVARHVDGPVKLIWTREEDIQHDLYRPYYYDRISGGIDAAGHVVGWSHRVTGSSVMARWAPAGMKLGGKLDPDAVEGSVETPYDFPAQHVEYVRHETPGVTTLWWRGVGPTHNVFVVESFVDELANLAGTDPVAFRRTLVGGDTRARAVLDLVAERSQWGTPLPPGVGRGVALQFAFGSYLAAVLEVEVTPRGEIHLRHATVAVDCGPVVNPDTVVAQIQGGLIFGLSAAMYNEITLRDGRVTQSNFDDYRALRINEAPTILVHIVNNPGAPIGGIGETGTAIAAPALANAIFAATKKRLRRIPFGLGQLVAA